MGLSTEFVAIGFDGMYDTSDDDATPKGEKLLSPPPSARRRNFEDALRESLLDENNDLEHKVRELEVANTKLRQSCAKKGSELEALRKQVSEQEGQLVVSRKTPHAETRDGNMPTWATLQAVAIRADSKESAEAAEAVLEQLTEELQEAREHSCQTEEEAVALRRQAQEHAEAWQDQLEEVETQRCQLHAKLQSMGAAMKESECSFESERTRLQQMITNLKEEAEALMLERNEAHTPETPCVAKGSLLAQLHTSYPRQQGWTAGADHETLGGPLELPTKALTSKQADLEAQTLVPSCSRSRSTAPSMCTPMLVLLILQTLVAVLRIGVLKDIVGGSFMAVLVGFGWYAWRADVLTNFVGYWGLMCFINGTFALMMAMDEIARSPTPHFTLSASPAHNLNWLLVVLIPVSQLLAAPWASHLCYKRHGGREGGRSRGGKAASYATFEDGTDI
jgi:hypothetical protein